MGGLWATQHVSFDRTSIAPLNRGDWDLRLAMASGLANPDLIYSKQRISINLPITCCVYDAGPPHQQSNDLNYLVRLMATAGRRVVRCEPTLLRLIQDRQPRTLQELAELSGRAVSNLSRTLRNLGTAQLRPATPQPGIRAVRPEVLATEFLVELD